MTARDEARILSADDELLERWYRDHHEPLRRYCARLLSDLAGAEDIAQETLVRAWANRQALDPDGDIRPWLYRVARNLCTDVLRARTRFSDVVPPEHPDADADPATPIERAETSAMVRRALDGLTSRQREILMLRDVEGIDYAELASRMGVNENTARAVLFRARRGLRKRVLEVARATATLAAWPILRLRARRSLPLEQLAVAAGHAGLSIAAAVVLLISPASGDVLRSAATEAAARASAAGAAVQAVVAPTSADPSPTSSPSSHPSAAPVVRAPSASVTADRSGEVHVRATTPNPVTGGDADVWADIRREADGHESTVLNTYDDLNQTACAGLPGTCDVVDQTLPTTEAP